LQGASGADGRQSDGPVWSNAQWGFPGLAGHATAYSYRTEDSYDSDERGVLFYLACAPAHKPAPRRSMCCLLTAAR
jgi:hypothetical protein